MILQIQKIGKDSFFSRIDLQKCMRILTIESSATIDNIGVSLIMMEKVICML